MSQEIALANALTASPPSLRADSDDTLIKLWLHGRPPHTQRAYQTDLRRFRGQVTKPLAAVTLTDLQSFADSLSGLKGSTRYRILSAVKSLLAFGHRTGYLAFDVGRVLKLPAVHDNLAQRILPEAEVHRMLSLEPNERNRALLTLFYASGARVGEICGLAWNNLQSTAEGGQITVLGKGSKTRSIQLPPAVWKQLLKLRGTAGAEEPVFRSRKKGSFLRSLAVYRVVRQAAKRAQIEGKISPHWLRHAHASHALDRGAPIHLVQATLGHTSLATTSRYLHARPKESSSRYLAL